MMLPSNLFPVLTLGRAWPRPQAPETLTRRRQKTELGPTWIASRLQTLPTSKMQFNVETNCRDAGGSLTNASQGPNDRDQGCGNSRRISEEAVMSRKASQGAE